MIQVQLGTVLAKKRMGLANLIGSWTPTTGPHAGELTPSCFAANVRAS